MAGPVNFARRMFMRRGAGAAAVAPFLPAALGGQMQAGNHPGMPPIGGGLVGSAANGPAPVAEHVIKKFWRAREERDLRQQPRQYLRHALGGGYDPDIACLISVSPAYKMRMQADRTAREREEERGWLGALKRKLGMPEDW